mmetsp:Transcript_33143/g.93002  ORF Transcript_33143/g.93002 Transcript_33143/m.93002 type:complete len:250 (-) Transcript_33143:535-1284(-)
MSVPITGVWFSLFFLLYLRLLHVLFLIRLLISRRLHFDLTGMARVRLVRGRPLVLVRLAPISCAGPFVASKPSAHTAPSGPTAQRGNREASLLHCDHPFTPQEPRPEDTILAVQVDCDLATSWNSAFQTNQHLAKVQQLAASSRFLQGVHAVPPLILWLPRALVEDPSDAHVVGLRSRFWSRGSLARTAPGEAALARQRRRARPRESPDTLARLHVAKPRPRSAEELDEALLRSMLELAQHVLEASAGA